MADNLEKYRQKRDFKVTAEPEGIVRKTSGHRYLIQKHAASRLHYDFRLELDGTLKSWAVTRGPSLDPADKRLAVEVEDHPVDYGRFEGTIPQGHYGGGTVMLWDEGDWEPIGDPHEGLKKGDFKFRLNGKRLQGEWVLVRMKPRPQDKGRNNWLLIKHHDGREVEGDDDHILTDNMTSIVSGRTMEEIAAGEGGGKVWKSSHAEKTAPKKKGGQDASAQIYRTRTGHPGRHHPDRQELAARGQVRRLSHLRLYRGWQRADDDAQGTGLDAEVPGPGRSAGGPGCEIRHYRRRDRGAEC